MRTALFLAVLAMGLAACEAQEDEDAPIEGIWRLISIETITDGAPTSVTARESLVIFADGHYSMAWASGDTPSPPYATRWTATDAERAARMAALLMNAGTYEIDGNRVTTRPMIALVPEFVGGFAEHEFSIAGDTLQLVTTSIVSSDGVTLPALAAGGSSRYRFVRIVTADED